MTFSNYVGFERHRLSDDIAKMIEKETAENRDTCDSQHGPDHRPEGEAENGAPFRA